MSEMTTITAQVPTELRDKVNEIADREHRSASGQVRLWLESAIADYWTTHRREPSPVSPRLSRQGRAA